MHSSLWGCWEDHEDLVKNQPTLTNERRFPNHPHGENPGTSMSKPLSRRSRDFFRGSPTHLFGVTRFGAPVVYVRAGSSHLNEVAWPQSPGAESGRVIPQIVA